MAAVSVKRFIESLGSVHAILDSVSSRREKLLDIGIAKTATALGLTSSSHTSNIVPERLAESQLGELSPKSHS